MTFIYLNCIFYSVIPSGVEASDPPDVFNSIDASFQMRLKELEEKQEVNIHLTV